MLLLGAKPLDVQANQRKTIIAHRVYSLVGETDEKPCQKKQTKNPVTVANLKKKEYRKL